MELGVVGHGGPIDYGSKGLGQDRIGFARTRHLLPVTAFPRSANPKNPLNPQEISALPQVFRRLHQSVASL
jgi:hypothetical protein